MNNRKAMNAAWRKCRDEEIPLSIGVNIDDARSFFEDGWRAAMEWMSESARS